MRVVYARAILALSWLMLIAWGTVSLSGSAALPPQPAYAAVVSSMR
jgi:hypothetical protein